MYLCYLFIFIMLLHCNELLANTTIPTTLNLNDAISLAVKQNSAVQIATLNTRLATLAKETAAYQLTPHFAFETSADITRKAGQPFSASIGPAMAWQTPIGPTVAVSSNINNINTLGLSLNIAIPLLQGFGKPIVDNALQNAKDNEKITTLTLQNQIAIMINNVINTYLDLMQIEALIKIDEAFIRRTQLLFRQTALLIQAGSRAGNELMTLKATIASAKSTLENDNNTAIEIKHTLMDTIGLPPNTKIIFTLLNLDQLILKYATLPLQQMQKEVLTHDLQYQIDAITLNGPMTRAYLTAHNNEKWMLDLNMNVSTETNNIHPTEEASLTLSIPINDVDAENATASALIALKEAHIAFTAEGEEKENNALNFTHQLTSAKRAFIFAQHAALLQEQNNQMNHEKFLHGLADSFELTSSENAYTFSQVNLLQTKINYIKTLVIADTLMGHTLNTWQIKIRKTITNHEII